jgi:hypothetical protein
MKLESKKIDAAGNNGCIESEQESTKAGGEAD